MFYTYRVHMYRDHIWFSARSASSRSPFPLSHLSIVIERGFRCSWPGQGPLCWCCCRRGLRLPADHRSLYRSRVGLYASVWSSAHISFDRILCNLWWFLSGELRWKEMLVLVAAAPISINKVKSRRLAISAAVWCVSSLWPAVEARRRGR
jgi:hypothetical protein